MRKETAKRIRIKRSKGDRRRANVKVAQPNGSEESAGPEVHSFALAREIAPFIVRRGLR